MYTINGDNMKNKFIFIVAIIFFLGVIMLLGSSYSLIMDEEKNNQIIIPEFTNSYTTEMDITILNNVESNYQFEIINNSGEDIDYQMYINHGNDNKLNKMINYSYALNNYQSDIYRLSDKYIVIQDHLLNKDMHDIYNFNFSLSEIYDNKEGFKTSLIIYVTKKIDKKYLNNVIKESSYVTKINDNILYNSENSPNYVWFNCHENNCERWQIIGSFKKKNNENISVVKIMKAEPLKEMNFNNEDLDGNYRYSYINKYLNGYYYEQFSSDTLKMIKKSIFNIGDVKSNNYYDAYIEEQKEYINTYVGLLNVSDYLIGNSWIHFNEEVMLLNKNGNYINVIDDRLNVDDSNKDMSYVPCVYLDENISIISGDGTYDSPYKIGFIY